MVRIPQSWARAGYARYAGSIQHRGIAARRIPVPPDEAFRNQVTVDLGNDGMAPLAVFTAAGTAQAFVGPSSGGDLWSLDQCYLATSVGLLDASQVIVYVGPLPLPQYAVAPSLSGGGQQFGMGGVGVPFGWFAWAVWTGGTPGATTVFRLTGVKTVLSN